MELNLYEYLFVSIVIFRGCKTNKITSFYKLKHYFAKIKICFNSFIILAQN